MAVEIERQDPALELREDARQAGDEAASSSLAITRSAGSSEIGPGRTSSSVVSASPAAAGDWANETYWLSGACLLRLAVFTAVMIWRVMQSSAKLRKLDSRSVRKSRIAL